MRLKFSLLALLAIVGFGVWWRGSHTGSVILSPQGDKARQELPYDKYSFARLAERAMVASTIEVNGNKFYYWSEGRRISGEINMPARTVLAGAGDVYPVVVMARGYVEKESYQTGMGTHNAARYFAQHGYVTYAPDFSGYGESDPEPTSPPASLGSRLVKPVEILDLIASIGGDQPIYLWGHSNGGQIMLSVAEILRGSSSQVKGVTLWAPVSKPFPYNILYYTDDATDSGKWLRGEIAKFEQDYDVFNYSVDRYLDWIQIPVQIHQGTEDESVPMNWSDQLVANLKERGKQVRYFKYQGADHNLKPGWDKVVSRDVEWFDSL